MDSKSLNIRGGDGDGDGDGGGDSVGVWLII